MLQFTGLCAKVSCHTSLSLFFSCTTIIKSFVTQSFKLYILHNVNILVGRFFCIFHLFFLNKTCLNSNLNGWKKYDDGETISDESFFRYLFVMPLLFIGMAQRTANTWNALKQMDVFTQNEVDFNRNVQ